MKVAVFSTKVYDKLFLEKANEAFGFEFSFFETRLTEATVSLAKGCQAVCAFVNDSLDRGVLQVLSDANINLIALRCAGFNNVDLQAAKSLGIGVVRVPAYSPFSVAEHTLALILSLNRKIHRAYNRVREGNFSLDGLLGFDLHGTTIGIVGTGKIGIEVARILTGFGCNIIASDVAVHPQAKKLGVNYVDFDELLEKSDVLTLHCPLTPETNHMINAGSIAKLKTGVMLINTSRGGLVDTTAVIAGLKSKKIGYLGLDVYEEEANLFFEDFSDVLLQDDIFARLLTFHNVMITGHQAFFTRNALTNISETTCQNIKQYLASGHCENEVLIK